MRRAWSLRQGLLAGLASLAAASAAHAAPQNLSGFWVNADDTRSGYTLRMSTDLSVLNAEWAGVPPHQTLRGHFRSTQDIGGDTYSGRFDITEQPSVSVSGSGTFALRSSFFASFPKIDVTLTPDNGGSRSEFTLKIFSALPLVVPEGVTQEVTDPGTRPCSGYVDFSGILGSNIRRAAGSSVRPAAARKPSLGRTRFRLRPGKSRRISVSLNARGRRLLRKRGTLRLRVLIHMNRASGLPTLTKAGVVTLGK